jgi:hypothetical protein
MFSLKEREHRAPRRPESETMSAKTPYLHVWTVEGLLLG